jgi:hypothetical protein
VFDPIEWLDRAVRGYPDRVFLSIPGGAPYSYAALLDESGRIAVALRGLGVGVARYKLPKRILLIDE